MDLDIEVRRRDDNYILIANRFGAIARSKELKSGIEELERRIAIIENDYREAGIPVPTAPPGSAPKDEMKFVERVTPTLITLAGIAVLLGAVMFFAATQIASAIASFRAEVSSVRSTIATLAVDSKSGITDIAKDSKSGIIDIVNAVEGFRAEMAGVRSEMAGIRATIGKVIPADAKTGIAELGHFGVETVIAIDRAMGEMTPQRKEALTSAIRKIAREMDGIAQDLKTPPARAPQPSSGGGTP
jgi:hypothetical protein